MFSAVLNYLLLIWLLVGCNLANLYILDRSGYDIISWARPVYNI